MNVFETLNAINVNEYTEEKEGLTYLTWSSAWAELKKRFPDAQYTVWKNENGLPYAYDPNTGYMVYTTVTIEGITHEMWLPVMDGKNKAMKSEPYTYKTKFGEKAVEAATMFDVNKTVMRCLVKNLAMFGLGLYIYAGEDLPEVEKEEQETVKKDKAVEEAELKAKVLGYINRHKMSKESIGKICELYGIKKITEISGEQCKHYIATLEKKGGKINE